MQTFLVQHALGFPKAQAYRAYVARNIRLIVVRHIKFPSLHNLFLTWHKNLRVYLWLWALISMLN